MTKRLQHAGSPLSPPALTARSPGPTLRNWGPVFLLVASGTAALVYQVLWIKQLSLIVGVDVYAVTIGVSAFFAGLAFGGLALGRLADRVRSPLRLYATLEVGVAVLGVATTAALAHTAPVFARLEARSSLLAWAMVFAMAAVAPFLMGGTLPAAVRSLALGAERIGSGGGWMYAANTTGGIVGALASSFLLIPWLGIHGTAVAAAGLGGLAAAGGFWLARLESLPSGAAGNHATAPTGKAATIGILLYALAGALALGYEVVWSQAVVPFMSTRSFAFSVMLATYLVGLAGGAALFARWADRVRDPWGTFGLLIAAAGLVALLAVTGLGPWLPDLQARGAGAALGLTGSQLVAMCARFAIAAGYFILVPTLFLGAAFPAALRLIVDAGHVGRDIGKVVALNTIGGIAGSVVTGFVLVPRFGLVGALAILAVAAGVLGLVAAMHGPSGQRGARGAATVLALTAGAAAWLTPSDTLASLLAATRGGTMVFYQEGQGGTVAVLEQTAGRNRFRRLYIQGVSNTGDAMTSLRYMRLQALLPLVIHGGQPTSALVIGLGTGITSGALLQYPGLEHRVVAELLPEVVRAAVMFQGNYGATTDPRLDLRLRDGRRELLSNGQTYDVITLEPPPPSAAGVVNLYSSDFYQLARARLRPGGLAAQWLPLPTQNDEDTRSLVRSFLEVFPYASLWTTELHEMLLMGSVAPLDLYVPRIIERFNQPGVAAALQDVGVDSPEALMGTWVTDRGGLERYAGEAPPVTDDQPRIEYADWVRPDELDRVLPSLLDLRTDPPLRGADEAFLQSVAAHRTVLLTFSRAALNARAGDRAGWARDMQRVFEADGDNPYFRWFGGGGVAP